MSKMSVSRKYLKINGTVSDCDLTLCSQWMQTAADVQTDVF